jgi:hypothetical protein
VAGRREINASFNRQAYENRIETKIQREQAVRLAGKAILEER